MRAASRISPIDWVRANLFNSWLNGALTVVLVAFLAWLLPKLYAWAVTDAVFAPDSNACRTADGACWGFLVEKLRLIMFGTYPYTEQWRPLATVILLLTLIGFTMNPRLWSRWLWISWLVGVLVMWILMNGGVFGLPEVETDRWGGLPLTLILAVNGIVFSFPLAILLALGRRSDMPAIKAICIAFIELVRGVPLITVLFMASLMIPLFLPEGITIDKLLRAQIAFILFAAAYEAEVVRGGLQAIPKGQFEAADALGLSYWQKTGFIILPQALRVVIPPMVNTFIGFFKDTSLVIIIGMFDLLGATRLASSDPVWRPYYVEGLVFVALIYFAFCFTMAEYSRWVERRLNTATR
ncbi:MAG TPA: amino acid ABC transporter permease [Hyphomicrobiaceae bacterium]|nr:amino acid ABC transporter permease [Hyphomicrobiaceae bacterium]